VDYHQFGGTCIAVLAAVSQERGVESVMCFEKSVNKEKFKVFLEELRARNFLDDICLVMDNLRVHHSNDVIDRIDELGFEYVFTPAYSPDFNPIESVFSIFKNKMKRMRIKAIQEEQPIDYEREIQRIFGEIEREKIINCVEHALNLLFKNY
jgi:transposase